jgi:hypothetical protein
MLGWFEWIGTPVSVLGSICLNAREKAEGSGWRISGGSHSAGVARVNGVSAAIIKHAVDCVALPDNPLFAGGEVEN